MGTLWVLAIKMQIGLGSLEDALSVLPYSARSVTGDTAYTG